MLTICPPHWEQMRNKLKELGLAHLGAQNPDEAIHALQAQLARGLDGPIPDSEWDPLAMMTFNFFERVLERLGFDGAKGCPLCIVRSDFDAHNTADGRCGEPDCTIQVEPCEEAWDRQWIDGCAEVMRVESVRRGLAKVS